MNMFVPDKYFKPRQCSVCERMFIVPDPSAWAYKRKPGSTTLYFCSWTCLRKWDKEHLKGDST